MDAKYHVYLLFGLYREAASTFKTNGSDLIRLEQSPSTTRAKLPACQRLMCVLTKDLSFAVITPVKTPPPPLPLFKENKSLKYHSYTSFDDVAQTAIDVALL